MEDLRIICENTNQSYLLQPGTKLQQFAEELFGRENKEYIAAFVDNQLRGLHFALYNPHNVRFITMAHNDGFRTWIRSLSFILQEACHELFPEAVLEIRYSVSRALYCLLRFPSPKNIDQELLDRIHLRMSQTIAEDIPFLRQRIPTAEAMKMFEETGYKQKALLQQTRGRFYTNAYFLKEYPSTFYGPLAPSTSYIRNFAMSVYHDGFLLQYPSINSKTTNSIAPIPKLNKLFDVFQEYAEWCSIMDAKNVGSINRMIQNGKTIQMIQVGEALHERKFADIADELYKRRDSVKLALIAGPSSSGKTTTSKRLALQAKVVGLNPVVLAMDNYFLNREQTPKDAKGEYDFESIEALDLAFLNQQLADLMQGKTVEIPKFDFASGSRFFDGSYLKVGPRDILIMEGIHALNPRLTAGIETDRKYKIYASALTSVSLDENNRISTTDNRLIRRMIRDSRYRGTAADDTIQRWASVRRGENRNIFPFQEEADIMFNSSLPFEFFVLRMYAEPLLQRITPCSAAYPEAMRLLNFLSYIETCAPEDIEAIPPTSILREFIGGSSFSY